MNVLGISSGSSSSHKQREQARQQAREEQQQREEEQRRKDAADRVAYLSRRAGVGGGGDGVQVAVHGRAVPQEDESSYAPSAPFAVSIQRLRAFAVRRLLSALFYVVFMSYLHPLHCCMPAQTVLAIAVAAVDSAAHVASRPAKSTPTASLGHQVRHSRGYLAHLRCVRCVRAVPLLLQLSAGDHYPTSQLRQQRKYTLVLITHLRPCVLFSAAAAPCRRPLHPKPAAAAEDSK
jgi:hypothetical protein